MIYTSTDFNIFLVACTYNLFIEIVSFPSKAIVIFHRYGSSRVSLMIYISTYLKYRKSPTCALSSFEWTHGGFLKWGYPQIINFKRMFHYKASLLGHPHLWKPLHHLELSRRNARVYSTAELFGRLRNGCFLGSKAEHGRSCRCLPAASLGSDHPSKY